LAKEFIAVYDVVEEAESRARFCPYVGTASVSSNSSIETFMAEEFHNAIRLVQKIHRNIAILNKICKGNALPNDTDMLVGNSLINYQVNCHFYFCLLSDYFKFTGS
jgi:hypothetical protein